MLRLITTYRSYLKKVGKGGMPIWITESGKPWKRGNANPQRTYGGPHGKLRAEADEDRVSARWITLKAVEAKAGGVAGYFPFTLRSFREGPNNFGMMDFQWTPHRSLAAYFFCAQILANCDYIGDLNRLPRGIWSAGSLPVPTGRRSPSSMPLENLSTFPVESCRKARCLPRMARNFVRMPLANTRWRITAISGSPPGRRRKIAEGYSAYGSVAAGCRLSGDSRNASPIVYQFSHKAIRNKGGYRLSRQPDKVEGHRIQPLRRSAGDFPGTGTAGGSPPAKSTGKTYSFPRSSAVLEWEVDASGNRDFPLTLLLTDSRNQSAPLPLVFLRFDRTRIAELDFSNPKRWKANSSGTMEITADSEKKHSISIVISAKPVGVSGPTRNISSTPMRAGRT
ncbi:MAG: hypothetical protein L6W00_17035 [Lentisphaeria bacterium]|nr:MAG: hypothetical protein L6W00_17035 [Lentisphaeria bacterium]